MTRTKHILKFTWALIKPWVMTLAVVPLGLLWLLLYIAHEVVGIWIMAGDNEEEKRKWQDF